MPDLPAGLPLYAKVRILDVPYHLDREFDYFIPDVLRESIQPGDLTVVPFGGGNRKQFAAVTAISEQSDCPKDRIKPIGVCLSKDISLSREELSLCSYLSTHTFCSFGDAVKAILPPGCIERYLGNEDNAKDTLLTLAKEPEEIEAYLSSRRRPSPAQDAVLNALLEEQPQTASTLRARLSLSSIPVKALVEKGLVAEIKADKNRDPYLAGKQDPPDANVLSEAQSQALNTLRPLADGSRPRAALLYGVTGSGKTRVIKALTDEVLASGRSVLILVPEIALTPQTVDYFRRCYGGRIAVIHSSLSAGERQDAYLRIKRGQADICIGTRSAVFAPFDNLGMIVIDEEQEHTYKSDRDPKYHARDVAAFRCGVHNSLLLLASATPSLESYHKAVTGAYTLVSLTERYGKAVLPETEICDMRPAAREGDLAPIGPELANRIEEAAANGQQAILLLNRRGYNNYLTCPQCGSSVSCPHCSVTMTYHLGHDRRGYLSCHYCGYRSPVPEKCPECGRGHLTYIGWGIQKAEEYLSEKFPSLRVCRMDADTTAAKFSVDEMIERFRRHEYDVLLGTQMVTKGHDFPEVTLSGVINSDMSLYLDDYRANERTFAMLTQVIGRAGRADKPGRAVIQTMNPDHPILALAAAQDYAKFYEGEIKLRRALIFPPFCDLVLITLSASDEPLAKETAVSLCTRLKTLVDNAPKQAAMIIYGPFEAPVYRVDNRYRMRLVVKCRLNRDSRAVFSALLTESAKLTGGRASVSLDVNPNSL